MTNVGYKIVTKVPANRMQGILPLVVGSNQSAIIKGRSIVDNVLLMHELIRNYHRNASPSKCALKIDLIYLSISYANVVKAKSLSTLNLKFLEF